MVPLTLYGTGIIWSPQHVCMVPPQLKCIDILYDSYGPPCLIWIRYHVVPTTSICPPTCMMWFFQVTHTLYGIGIRWSLPYLI